MTKLIVLVVGTLAACGGGKGGGNEALEKTTAFTDAMCACKDADCAKKVMDDMAKWSTEYAKAAKPGEPRDLPTAEEQKKYDEVGKRMVDCSMKAQTPAK